MLSNTEDFDEKVCGENFGKGDPFDDVLLDERQGALDEDEVAIGWPRKGGDFSNKGVGGDEFVEVGLLDCGLNCVLRGGEVKVDGDLVGKEDGEVGNHAAFAGREQDADALLFGGFSDFLGEGDGNAEDFGERQFGVVGSVVQEGCVGVALEAFQESNGKGAVEKLATGEGGLGGLEEGFLIAGQTGFACGHGDAEGEDGGRESAGGLDAEFALGGNVDRKGGDPEI